MDRIEELEVARANEAVARAEDRKRLDVMQERLQKLQDNASAAFKKADEDNTSLRKLVEHLIRRRQEARAAADDLGAAKPQAGSV